MFKGELKQIIHILFQKKEDKVINSFFERIVTPTSEIYKNSTKKKKIIGQWQYE
jgi:hypothetical protein